MSIMVDAGNGNHYEMPPDGTHNAVCVDVVDCGFRKKEFNGNVTRKREIAITFQLDEMTSENKRFVATCWYNASLHEKSTLRKVLDVWRGKPFTPEELKGFDLEKLIGAPALVTINHYEKRDGSTGSKIASISRLVKGMEKMTPDYESFTRVKDRPDYLPNIINGIKWIVLDEPTRELVRILKGMFVFLNDDAAFDDAKVVKALSDVGIDEVNDANFENVRQLLISYGKDSSPAFDRLESGDKSQDDDLPF